MAIIGQRTRGADTGGHIAEELVHEFAQPRLDLLACEPRRHQPHAAVDVVADAARQTTPVVGSNAATPPIGKP